MLLGLLLHFTMDHLARPAELKVGHIRRWTNTGLLLTETTVGRSSTKLTWPATFRFKNHPQLKHVKAKSTKLQLFDPNGRASPQPI